MPKIVLILSVKPMTEFCIHLKLSNYKIVIIKWKNCPSIKIKERCSNSS